MHLQLLQDSTAARPAQLCDVDTFDDAVIGMAFCSLEGRILRVNQALCEIVDRDSADLLWTRWADLTSTDDDDGSHGRLAPHLTGAGDQVDFEARLLRPDGSLSTAHVTGSLVAMDGIPALFLQIRDVSDERSTLAALWAAEQRWRALADSSADVTLWVRLMPRLEVNFVSHSAFGVLGYEPADFYADPTLCDRAVHPIDRHVIEQLRSDPQTSEGALVRWFRRDGTMIWVEQRITNIASGAGDPTDVVFVIRDVTERVVSDEKYVRHAAQQRALTNLARMCAADGDSASVLGEAVTVVRALVPCDITALWWQVESGDMFRLEHAEGFDTLRPGYLADTDSSHAAQVAAATGVTWFRHRGALATTPGDDALQAEGARSGFGVPVRCGDHVIGVLAAYQRSDVLTSPEDVTFVEAVANIVGRRIDHDRFDQLLTDQSLHDPLTNLPNRVALVGHLDELMSSTKDVNVIVALCDVDGFELLNEAMGHDVGDRVLIAVANRLTATLGDGVFIARTGGDDFACVVECPAHTAGIDSIGRAIVSAMSKPLSLGGRDVAVSLSVGLTSTSGSDTADEALASALMALHEAKGRGPAQWICSSDDGQATAARRLDLTLALRSSVVDGSVEAHFQPIIDLRDGAIVGFEALARWTTTDGSVVSPAEFIPMAERNGVIDALGLAMLDQACEFVERSREQVGTKDFMVTVNLSPRQLEEPHLVANVAEVLARHGVSAGAMWLELTESALIPDDRVVIEQLRALKEIGIRIALDDFGTGYSSFAYLTDFPIDLLKLDRAFVTNLHDDPRRLLVVRSIVALAHSLGIVVLAEGVETEAELDILNQLGCDLGQGFVWSSALPMAQAIASISDGEAISVSTYLQ